ncbi:hypothetical protein KR044_011453 [Drosophila immigrans]|nr:hypothetical protein KR044_011453 [Drosophila immigrans]
MRELHSSICLILWLNLCLVIYLLLPDKPRILPQQQLGTGELESAYSEKPEQLIDLHNFDYLINQSPCEPHVEILIMIHSAPAHLEKRSVIRATWGSESVILANSSLRLLFLFGGVDDGELQLQLWQEQARYGDVLQGNFQDAYFNLSYKHVMALKWFDNHCHTAQMLLKVDDDVYLNTPLLLQQPHAALLQQQQQLLLCARQNNARVLRSYASKWRVSFREYADRFYPPFCPGFAIVYSPDVVRRLYWAAQRSSCFRLDDVFVTGLLAKRSNISITDLTPYVLYPQDLQAMLRDSVGAQRREFLVSWHKMSGQQIKELWLLQAARTMPAN